MCTNDNSYNMIHHSINFPPTAVGKSTKMTVEIPAFHEDREFYQVVRENNDELDEVCFIEYKTYCARNKKHKFVVTFKPKVPFCRLCNSFEILERNARNINIVAYVESIGPVVEASVEELQFICNNTSEERKKIMELRNISSIETIFQFDLDPELGFFTVDKLHGVIPAGSYVYINVFYRGKVPGIHSTKLFCLIEDGLPIVINLSAINSINIWAKDKKLCPDVSNFIYYPIPTKEAHGFKGYLQDITPILYFDPPFSITASYIDFGYVKYGTTSSNYGFSVTNHMKKDIYIIWDVDIQEIFIITPSYCTIKSDDCEYFECSFRPSQEDKLYGSTFNGAIYWTSPIDDAFTIPIPLTMRFIGHSFLPNHGMWIPQVTFKHEYVIMPPCLPTYCCYKTVTIHRAGILPVLFKFVPPKNSHYVLKPMAGLLKSDYQIVVISLCSNVENEDIYYENWKILLNDKSDYEINFQIRGKTENPILEIGTNNDNSVHFNNCRTFCQQGSLVKIQNKTRHSIKYEVIIPQNLKKYVEVYDETDILVAHQSVYSFWLWTGMCNGFRSIEFNIRTTAIQYKETLIGISQDTKVTTSGLVTPSELCSFPTYYSFDECEFGTNISTYFYIYNFGESEIHYELECLYETDEYQQQVDIFPLYGTLQPKRNEKIVISVTPYQTGLQFCRFIYNIRKNMYSDEIVDTTKTVLFTLCYFCVLPTLQIVDLHIDNFSSVLSRISLWELLNTDKFNKILKNIFPNESKEICMQFPDSVLYTDSTISLMLKNTSKYKFTFSIERKQLCNCKKVEKPVGISIRKMVYDCPHRETVSVSPKQFDIEGKATMSLNFYIHYNLCEVITLKFVMKLSHNREINIFIKIRAIDRLETLPSSLLPFEEFYFQDIYIGTQYPIIQLLWLYNNTSDVTKYGIYMKSIDERNLEFGENIINCLNPEGIVNPMSNHPIKLIFIPKQMRRYEFYTVLNLGDSNFVNLRLVGNGISYYKFHAPTLWGSYPRLPPRTQAGDLIKLSRDHIVVKSMQIFNTEERLLFIENISNVIVGYRWTNVRIPNLIRVSVIQRKGTLKLNEKRSIRIKIQAEQHTSVIKNLVLSCEVFDVKQRRQYETTLVEFGLDKHAVEEEFTMTENSIVFHDTTRKIELCPKISLHTVSVSCLILPTSPAVDLKATVREQLEYEPEIENFEVLKMKNVLDEAEEEPDRSSGNGEKDKLLYSLDLIMSILQSIIRKILESKEFKWNILRFAKKRTPYYEQVVSSANYEENYNPTDKTVASLFQKLTLQCLTSIFGLKPMLDESNQRIFENPLKEKHRCQNCDLSSPDDIYENCSIPLFNKSLKTH